MTTFIPCNKYLTRLKYFFSSFLGHESCIMSSIYSKDPLKIEIDNVKLEAEADLEDDPLKLDQDLSTPINAVKTEEEISNYNDHEFTEQRSKENKKNLQCDKCPAIFQYFCSLNAHSNKIHEKNKLDFHKCDFCDLKL